MKKSKLFRSYLTLALNLGVFVFYASALAAFGGLGTLLGFLGLPLIFAVFFSLFNWVSMRPKRIKQAPGTLLMSIVSFLYSPGHVEKIFEPTLADWHMEYFEALGASRLWKARWISVRYYYRFAAAMGLSKAWKLIDKVIKVVTSAISK